MQDETQIGGENTRFPQTRLTGILAVHSDNEQERTRAMDALISAYWKPVYKYIRFKWNKNNEDAKDLTQGFFVKAIEKAFLDKYDPERSRFRTYLRTCLDGFVANEIKAGNRLKRGGGKLLMSLDFDGAEHEISRDDMDNPKPDAYFDQEWMRSLFALAIHSLEKLCQERGKSTHFALFQRYDLHDDSNADRPTYEVLAGEFDLPVTQVTNYLAFARREFRQFLLDHLRDITSTEEEYRSEARHLLGIKVDGPL